ncbi:MAG: hypothetical protein QM724_01380 [Flavobacteriales bacterium]
MKDRRWNAAKVPALVLGLLVVASGCLRTEKFPVEPKITFKEFKQFGDSASLVISFTDGDGDIGLAQGDTLGNFAPGSQWYHNLFVDYYAREHGTWVLQDFTLPLYYRIPVITPTGQNKALEGDIAVALKPYPVLPGTEGDSIRLNVRLADRALHMSNEVETGIVVVQSIASLEG